MNSVLQILTIFLAGAMPRAVPAMAIADSVDGGWRIEFSDPATATADGRPQPTVSLSLKDAEVERVVRLLARKADLNVVILPGSLKGRVSLELVNVPVDAALRSVLRTQGLELVSDSPDQYSLRTRPQGGVARGVAFLSKSLRGRIPPYEHHLRTARRLIGEGRLDEAAFYLREVIKQNPDNLEAVELLSSVAEERRKKAQPEGEPIAEPSPETKKPGEAAAKAVRTIRLDLSRGNVDEKVFVAPYGGVSVVDGQLRLAPGAIFNTVAEIDPAETPVEISLRARFLTDGDGIRVSTRSSGDNKGAFLYPSDCVSVGALGPNHARWGNLRFGVLENGEQTPTAYRQGTFQREIDMKVRDDGRIMTVWANNRKLADFPCEKRFPKNHVTISPVQQGDGATLISRLEIVAFERPGAKRDPRIPGDGSAYRVDHVVISSDGIEQEYVYALARTAEVAREVAAERFGFDMPDAIHLSARHRPDQPTRLYNDGRDRVFLTVSSPDNLRKPAESSVFHLYGLCHEVGHLAMYRPIRDHSWMAGHAAESWAHYLGSRIVDEVYESEGEMLWPDSYDYRADGMQRLNRQLARPTLSPYQKTTGLWKELAEIVGDRGIAPIFSAWGAAEIDPADPGPALREALTEGSMDPALAAWWTKAEPLLVVKRAKSEFEAQTADPGELSGKLTELAHDDGGAAGQKSIAGGGHAVRFDAPGGEAYLTAVRVHGSRYGRRQPPDEKFHVWLCDADFKPISDFALPYSSFAHGSLQWVRLPVTPTRVPSEFIVCVAFNPTATKGVFVSRDKAASGRSLTGLPGRGSKPALEGDWLLRAEVDFLKSADPLRAGEPLN